MRLGKEVKRAVYVVYAFVLFIILLGAHVFLCWFKLGALGEALGLFDDPCPILHSIDSTEPPLPPLPGDTGTGRNEPTPPQPSAQLGAGPTVRDNDRKPPVDLAEDNDQFRGTATYWKHNDARGQSSGSGTGSDIGIDSDGGLKGGVFRVGGGVSAPRLTYKVDPEYSEEARRAKYEGTVVLAIQVWEDGRAHNIRVIRSLGLGLDEKAIQAVQKWRFVPGKKDGVPVKVHAKIEVNFRLL